MASNMCAKFSRIESGGDGSAFVVIEDTKITDLKERTFAARAMPLGVWLVRKAAVINMQDAAPLFENQEQLDAYSPGEQSAIVDYFSLGRLDELDKADTYTGPVTAYESRAGLIVPFTPDERREYDALHDPALRQAEPGFAVAA